jgi:hypothetical protein
VVEEDGGVYLELTLAETPTASGVIESTATLGKPRIADALYDGPDGAGLVFDRDYLGKQRAETPAPGPIEAIKAGKNRIKVW